MISAQEDIKNICKLYELGASSIKIADQYNCQYPAITRILKKNNIKIRLPTDRKRLHSIINENYFDSIDTEQKAYILGFFYADAYNSTDNYQIKLTLAVKDLEILKKLSFIFYNKEKLYYHQNYISLVIYNKRMSLALAKLGCTQKKTFSITFPNFLSKEFHNHFVRGYFDGDGCLYINDKIGKISIASTHDMLFGIKKILQENLNINCQIKKPKNKNIYYLYITGNRQTNTFLNWLYKDSTIFLERKWQKNLVFKEIILNLNQNKANNCNQNMIGGF